MRLQRCLSRFGQIACRQYGSTVRVACASGFWGDTTVSTPQLVYGKPKVDFIVYDYLSEITMSLLAAAKSKNSDFGYCPDFVQFHMAPNLPEIQRRGVKIITNAGGLNPQSCAQALRQVAQQKGVEKLQIATVLGDDMMSFKDQFLKSDVKDMDSGESAPSTFISMNAYFGAGPIKRALDLGADIVITGRCVDSALALGPLMHAFNWSDNSLDLLATGSLAGHLIECGAQSTGGIHTDWTAVPSWETIGFPIVEFDESSQTGFRLTKPEKSGGLVNFGTVSEQLVYEIGNPKSYLLPDVTADFSEAEIKETSTNVVSVDKARGFAPSNSYKVSATYASGYRCISVCPVIGPRAEEKGRKTAEAILARCRLIFKQLKLPDFSKTEIHMVGPGLRSNLDSRSQNDVMLWLGVQHPNKTALELFAREIAPAGTGMAPGLTTVIGGRPRVSPVLKLFSFLVPKQDLKAEIFINGEHRETYEATLVSESSRKPIESAENVEKIKSIPLKSGLNTYQLSQLAYTRSGDKGNTANVGVVCRHPNIYPYLKERLTAERVGEFFAHAFDSDEAKKAVKRYELPGICALNFVLPASLGGGGVASLRFDPQGKGYGQMLLQMKLKGLPEFTEIKSLS